MKITVPNFIQTIHRMHAAIGTLLVGIDGGAGAGKTTFAHWLAESIGKHKPYVNIVHADNFYHISSKRTDENAIVSDCDWQRLRDQVIIPLLNGRTARFQLYDWFSDTLSDFVSIHTGGIVFVEGVNAIRRELASLYDLCIWITCPREIRVSRILARGDMTDAEIRTWMPSEDEYVSTHIPENSAHLVIDSNDNTKKQDGKEWMVSRWTPPAVEQKK